jgi:uncharacterized LabA/DUF88 family protein/cold shock CspA family protein
MTNDKDQKLTRIGVFYDGNYFLHVSNYYNWFHERKTRISISGLHNFIRTQVAHEESTDARLCQIVDAHYFRGRLNATDAMQRGNQLYYDRVFDDILMSEGVTTHFLPVKTMISGFKQEKGIDVWLALEAFELAFYKRFNVLVLIACDGDYVPLIRKLNTLGTRVMVLSWDFEYINDDGQKMITRTSQDLLEEVTYPVAMHEIIENRVRKSEPLINNLFVPASNEKTFRKQPEPSKLNKKDNLSTKNYKSEIHSLKAGYGFIKHQQKTIFFHYSGLIDVDFNDLLVGDKVEYTLDKNDKGEDVAKDIRLID